MAVKPQRVPSGKPVKQLVASAMPTAATLPVAAPKAAKVVALRGGPAVSTVKLTGVAYRVQAPHNVAWWDAVNKCIAAGKGSAAVTDIIKAGPPATMVGYLIRRGYLAAV